MSDPNQQPIIIKKKKKGHGHGHHGGAWKVAYADFVTAMMAFFLLLWLLNVTTSVQKEGIADYFTPNTSVSSSRSGGGDVLGGSAVSEDDLLASPSLPPVIQAPVDNVSSIETKPFEEDVDEELESKEEPGGIDEYLDERKANLSDVERLKEQQEREAFEQAAAAIKQAVESDPELKDLASSLIVEQTREGLRIQLIDQENLSLFPLGSAEMYAHTRAMLQKMVQVISQLPNKVKVTGHTDSKPYGAGATYTNWELSADRANSSRRVMEELGLPDSRIAWISGKADKQHLLPDDPMSPRNRRISILLLRDEIYKASIGQQHEMAN